MLMKLRSRMQNQKGFTLVELMVVVVIIGILVAIAVPVYNSVTEKAARGAVEANLRTIDGAIMMYYVGEDSPTDLTDVNDLNPDYLAQIPSGPDGITDYGITGDAPAQRATVTGKIGSDNLQEATLDTLPWS